jgi:protoheme IX farnesyltransferase
MRPLATSGAVTGWSAPLVRCADLFALVKPRLLAMEMLTLLGSVALAPEGLGGARSAALFIGTALVMGAANSLNMYLEREIDCKMSRTRKRPLPAGRLTPVTALVFGVVLAVVSIPLLTFGVNALTGCLAVAALIAYVNLYTPLKQQSTISTLVGAFPGAVPTLMGWTAITGRIDAIGLALFAVLFVWQVPHFHAIAMFRRKEYTRAGLKILPAERGEATTRRTIVAYLVLQLAVTLSLVPLGLAGPFYFACASALGLAYLGYGCVGLATGAGARWARNLFWISLIYLPLLYASLLVDVRILGA